MSPHRRALALIGVVVAAALAVADGVYLTLVHIDLELGGGGIGRLCHALSRTGCAVTGGRFGALFGLPVALYGAAGALATAAAAIAALRRRREDGHPSHAAVAGLGALSLGAALVMAALSALEGAFCPFCVAWYGLCAAMAGLGAAAAGGPRRALVMAALRSPATATGALAAAIFAVGVGGGAALYQAAGARAEAALAARVAAEVAATLAGPRLVGLDVAGNPRRRVGGAGEPVVIVEFSDFECPYCRRLWEATEGYFAGTERAIEVVFVNFPLDAACNPAARAGMHERACLAALAGECAERQGRFWEFAGAVFAGQPDLERADLLGHARRLGLDVLALETCIDDPATRRAIEADLALARRAGVTGTPTLVIDGYKVTGVVRGPFLEGLLAATRGRAGGR